MTRKILIDSNFLYSLYNPADGNYQSSQELTRNPNFSPMIPEITMPEVSFLFARKGGVPAVVRFLIQFAKAGNAPIPMNLTDFQRAGEIMAIYPRAELDFVDCAIMALSERLNITAIATYDRRDFSIFRPKHCDYLELLP